MTMDVPTLSTLENKITRGIGVLSGTAGKITLPLAGVHIHARVADRIAQVTVLETFRNELKEPLEAVYIFPLAGGSAVSEFELKVGARTLRGKIDERQKAREQYQKALDEGKRAALLEQERDDVFTVQVGNLPPGEEVTVKLIAAKIIPT
jgi:Ca-activated chloride channel family protein